MNSVKVQSLVQTLRLGTVRCICTTPVHEKNIRAGVPKVTNNRSKALTYEQSKPPYKIGVDKSWNSWNTANLHDETSKSSEITVQDMFIRKFMAGTWHNLFLSDVIIKRRQNIIIISGLVTQYLIPRKYYFLLGYTEELLSKYLKQPVKVEIQTVRDRKEVIFKYI